MGGADSERYELTRALDLQVAVLRLQRSELLRGASERERSVLATIASELGTNVLKYAERGTLELRRVRDGSGTHVELTVRDDGPGIADVDLALTERYSSGRTLGLGLPGVRRMADEFEIGPNEGGGTTVRVRKRLLGTAGTAERPATIDAVVGAVPAGASDTPPARQAFSGPWRVGAAVRPRIGNPTGGDAVALVERADLALLAVVDATGHGAAAHGVAGELVARLRAAFTATPDPHDLPSLLEDLHDACVGTSGAAAGLALLDAGHDRLSYLAVGNVRAAVVGAYRFSGVSRDGLLGRRWPTPFVQRAALHRGDLVLLWTDGLPEALVRSSTRSLLAAHAGSTGEDVDALCRHLVEAHGKRHDDAACMAALWRPSRATQ